MARNERGSDIMLFGQNYQPFGLLFNNFALGTRLRVGVDTSFWIGNLAAIRDGVLVLTDAQLHANMGKPIDGVSQSVRIPIRQITFVGQVDGPGGRDGKGKK